VNPLHAPAVVAAAIAPASAPAVAPAAASVPPDERAAFFAQLRAALIDGRFDKLVLAKPRGAAADLQRVIVRQVLLRNVASLQFVWRHATRDVTKNLSRSDGIVHIGELLGAPFMNAHLLTLDGETQLAIGRKGRCTLINSAVARGQHHDTAAPSTAHDRAKRRWVDLTRPFLVELGVTTPQHQLVPAMARKWKQINRFVEVFAHALAASSRADASRLAVVDFGAGKGYLTFAIHEWLCHVKGVAATVTGVELRPELVAAANATVSRLGLAGLQFEAGDVRSHGAGAADVMIALHACDVATDHAIHFGIQNGAAIIMCAPCCHQEVRPQLLAPHALRPILRHGVHLDQQAEMVTDGLRALLLQACGYDTQVFEFISLEHTSKNKMILAVRRADGGVDPAAAGQVEQIKQYYGIRALTLQRLLA
jgi:Methyltransferase domain